MNPFLIRFACVLLLSLGTTVACRAESHASSASSAGSASLGSVSDSIHGSSRSSSGKDKVAEGEYQVIEVAALPDRAGMLRLRLQERAAKSGEAPAAFLLDLPQAALGARGLAAGETVSVRERPYGLEFARTAPRGEAFFLVLNDDWRGELDAHAVTF